MKNKKIVLVANTSWSMFNFRYGVLSRFLDEGYKLTIIAPADEFSDKLRAMGCTVINLQMSAKGVNPLQDVKLITTLYQLYKKINPDFIIHYTIKPNIYGSIAAKLAGISSLAITTGLGYTFVNNNIIAKIARKLYKFAFLFPEEVWFLNDDDRHVFIKNKLIQDNRAVLLHGEGVDLEYFQPLPSIIRDGETRFLLIARMLWDKGIGEYVEAARLIKAKHKNVRFQLLGACGVENPSAIQREQISEWERQGVVEYLGTTTDVRPIISTVDCVVLPSYREGIPRTMLEAAAMAKPLIVTDVAGCRDIVLPSETGYMCPAEDAEALAMCCEKIIMLPVHERITMGHAGRKLMLKNFDEKLVIEKYIAFLKHKLIK
ncbi:glycosyltransferase family 4 protein [Aeromonas caviae]|uniref:glycosyltransferase family 4 protein n=1 Tax=Aeromonas caviae TaxID=648 RepID=UPI003A427D5C